MTETPFITKLYVVIVGIAFLSSLIGFRRDRPLHINMFAVFLGISFLVECYSLHLRRYNINNAYVYNPYMLVEFLVRGWFFYRIMSLKTVKTIIIIFLVFFSLFWLYSTCTQYHFEVLNTNSIVVGAFFTVVMSISYYYQLLASEKLVKLLHHTEFWIATGLLIFYSCQLPFFGLLHYLITYHLELARSLVFVLQWVDSLMYLLFTYAFLCQIQIKRS